jgi:hypothetical protein
LLEKEGEIQVEFLTPWSVASGEAYFQTGLFLVGGRHRFCRRVRAAPFHGSRFWQFINSSLVGWRRNLVSWFTDSRHDLLDGD